MKLAGRKSALNPQVVRYYDIVYERDENNYFWSITISNEFLKIFKSKNFKASKLSTCDFSTLYTSLPQQLNLLI